MVKEALFLAAAVLSLYIYFRFIDGWLDEKLDRAFGKQQKGKI